DFATPEFTAHSVSKGHGRIACYDLEACTQPCPLLNWPGVAQILKLTRTTIDPRFGECSRSTAYGITSLSPQQTSPDELLAFIRHHWTIENQLHWVRDVLFDEDHSQLRIGHTHHLMALFRNLVLSLLRLTR